MNNLLVVTNMIDFMRKITYKKERRYYSPLSSCSFFLLKLRIFRTNVYLHKTNLTFDKSVLRMLFSEAFRSLPCLPFESTFPQENPLSQIVYDYPLYIRLAPDPFP